MTRAAVTLLVLAAAALAALWWLLKGDPERFGLPRVDGDPDEAGWGFYEPAEGTSG